MTTMATIGYADGTMLEQTVPVKLVVNGQVVATAHPNGYSVLVFYYDLPAGTQAFLRLQSTGMYQPPAS